MTPAEKAVIDAAIAYSVYGGERANLDVRVQLIRKLKRTVDELIEERERPAPQKVKAEIVSYKLNSHEPPPEEKSDV